MAQLLGLLLACSVVLAFLRFHLVTSARSFREDFERQSFAELNRGETHVIARKLAALSKAEQFSCVSATKDEIVFFADEAGRCSPGLWAVQERVHEPNHGIEILFTMRLPTMLFLGMFAFLLVQAALAATIVFSQRRLLHLQHQHERELAALARQFAHDVESPLAILRLLKEERNAPEQSSLRARALERLEALVGFLRGEQDKAKKPESLARLLTTAAQEKEAEFFGRVSFKILWQAKLGSMQLKGSPFAWRRLLSNLLNNAIEASDSERAEIEITVHGMENGGIALSLRDYGRGVDPLVLRHVGERGFSLGKPSGQGLGYSMARDFMRSIGGKIELRAAEGKGAIVRIWAPAEGGTEVVLVDDDAELGRAWLLAAKAKGVSFQYFPSTAEFLAACDGLPGETPIYLDLEMSGSHPSPLELGSLLEGKGFSRLFLCTGRAKSSISKPAWALDVVGKTPPWL